MSRTLWNSLPDIVPVVKAESINSTIACVAEEQERKKPISIGMHGEDFDALHRKRRVDDVIIMAWLGARILRGSNALQMFAIACLSLIHI